MKQKKIPLRQCVGCMTAKPKKELVRIVKSKDGIISLDSTGKAAGRGAYICKDQECLKKAEKKKAFNRSFQQDVEKEVYEQLSEEMSKI